MAFSFSLKKKDKNTEARTGLIHTDRGEIQTPVFMPVGTQATVKAMTPDELEKMGAQIILGNTYHLTLRPGHTLIQKLGGLHQFMAWKGPILTDSGGFQVFSLAKLRKLTEEGVKFQSHIDGAGCFLSPESSIAIQEALGSNIMMVLDECTPYPATEKEARTSMELSLRWAARSLKARTNSQALFAIVQGSVYRNLRRQCLEELVQISEKSEHPFDGYALGGLSVGEPIEEAYAIMENVAPLMPEDKPRYVMGMGLPTDLIECIARGIDMFDCVIPTRNARNGQLFTWQGPLQIKHARYTDDPNPIDANCPCPTCQSYSRAYLRHLYLAKEILSSRLNTIHNLHFYLTLMQRAREEIEHGSFVQFQKEFIANYKEDV